MTPESRRRRLLGRLALAVLGPVFLLGVLEGGLRLAGYGYDTSLFLPVEEAGTYGANREFGWRFFPRAIARNPVPQAFAIHKPERTCRIFVLGGSAALGIPITPFAFARILEVMLQTRYPGVRFEVVNTAITAINSHVVLPIARECAHHEPDVYLVYLGNNEVIGPYGVGTKLAQPATTLPMIRFGIALRAWKIGQLLQQLTAGLAGEDDVLEEWRGMEMFAGNVVTADDPALTWVHDNYRRNLRDICRAGVDAGAKVVLSTVAVNIKDSPPFGSAHAADLSPTDLARWEASFTAGERAWEAGQAPAALESFRTALAIDDRYADLRFRLGQAALAVGDTVGAREQFAAALELDTIRFRTDARLNAIIRETAAEFGGRGVVLADAARYAAAHEPTDTGLPGAELFYEHVHLKFAGGYLLAQAIWPALQAALPEWLRRHEDPRAPLPDREVCARKLVFMPWNLYQSWSQIRTMVSQYPFTAQLDHEAYLAAIDARLTELREHATPELQRATYVAYRDAFARNPGDLLLGLTYHTLLQNLGQTEAAEAVWERIMRTQPPWPELADGETPAPALQ